MIFLERLTVQINLLGGGGEFLVRFSLYFFDAMYVKLWLLWKTSFSENYEYSAYFVVEREVTERSSPSRTQEGSEVTNWCYDSAAWNKRRSISRNIEKKSYWKLSVEHRICRVLCWWIKRIRQISRRKFRQRCMLSSCFQMKIFSENFMSLMKFAFSRPSANWRTTHLKSMVLLLKPSSLRVKKKLNCCRRWKLIKIPECYKISWNIRTKVNLIDYFQYDALLRRSLIFSNVRFNISRFQIWLSGHHEPRGVRRDVKFVQWKLYVYEIYWWFGFCKFSVHNF